MYVRCSANKESGPADVQGEKEALRGIFCLVWTVVQTPSINHFIELNIIKIKNKKILKRIKINLSKYVTNVAREAVV